VRRTAARALFPNSRGCQYIRTFGRDVIDDENSAERPGIEMQLTGLILTSVFLPALWGWGVHWLAERFWPVAVPPAEAPVRAERLPPPPDYQI
jgi:hypothetical protein